MPGDKQSKSNTSKPLTPALSSNFRNTKSPLTPRLVGSSPSSPVVTSCQEPFVRSKSPGKVDQVTTPLNGNITPRSGARKSRIGTESPSTPASVKGVNNGPASSGNETPKPNGGHMQGLDITSPRFAASTGALPKVGTPGSTPAVTVHRRISAAKSMVEDDRDISSKFFHADEVKSSIGSPGIEEGPRLPPARGHLLVGSPPLLPASPAPPSREGMNGREEDLDEKFFRANDIPQYAPPKRSPLPHIPTEKLNNTIAVSNGPNHVTSPPLSPTKVPNLAFARSSSPRQILPVPMPSLSTLPRTSAERPKSSTSSMGASQPNARVGHRKSISASSITTTPLGKSSGPIMPTPQPLDLRLAPAGSPRLLGNHLLSPDTLSPRSTSLASTNTVPTSVTSETDSSSSEIAKPQIMPMNPSDLSLDQATSPIQSQTDDAANARRERKVLDLEISNSSLLAINKTLERELRKQSTELRRYRRLSRSGRLSLASTTRTASGQSAYSLDTVTEQEIEDGPLSDLDEDSELDDIDDEGDSLVSNDSGSLTSPSARSRQRERDEKRLRMDLSKHKQLIVDSQKLTQTIMRCMTCCEELIREGTKALDYRVGIGDVKLGGRVLNDDELDERGFVNGTGEPEAGQGLLSPSLAKSKLDEAQIWGGPQPWAEREANAVALPAGITNLLGEVAGISKAE
ncbi:uncharacterized protein Z518_10374 [Rhinocladiella mackenziei CBS 650.93]|uniref:Uncharacterized protein n=1 Tax=Rhinocladiella mackenziei CBS 650.93 TaxID=1442369 RepID=A0A0D2IU10_9EURO|nr:uncharacterized protein Z518_10374 [Rhinocladiella mackenziei CBS 650.93]KIX00235.1 hypothetical protein Z518_10374 [Rhinocladiella mackenziei CBS 650.93]